MDNQVVKETETTVVESAPQSSQSSDNAMPSKSAVNTLANAAKSASSVTTAKRQRSLLDMMPSKPAAKKSRLSEPGSSQGSSQDEGSQQPSKIFKTAPGVFGKTPLNSYPFSLSGFKDGLSAEERELLELECSTIQLSWLKLLTDEIKKPYFLGLKRFLHSEGVRGADHRCPVVFPPAKDIYAWSKSPLGRVRVVIIGQDPYHNLNQAHGLCFSVPKGVQVPPSLKNIYAEIQKEYPEFTPPSHGNLSSWAQNGVLLLNTCLTVHAHQANSHANKGWEKFTERIIEIVCAYGGASIGKRGLSDGIVFMAWGAPAAKRVAKVDKKKHLILTSPHPSPLSAHRGFLGNGHFRKANEWLEQKYGAHAKIDWCQLDLP